jgi:hypothetical protein
MPNDIISLTRHNRETRDPCGIIRLSALRVLCRYRHKTRWSTHAPVRPGSAGNRAAIVFNREAVVRRTLASPAFDRLAA